MLFKSDTTRRRITMVAGLLFAIGMGQSLIQVFMANSSSSENTAQAADDRPPTEPIDLAKGYSIVLEREPNNQTALQGLVEVYSSQGNWVDMVAPLEKLIELNPQDQGYLALMETVKAELARQNTPPIQVPE